MVPLLWYLEPHIPVIDELTGYGAYTRVYLYKHRVNRPRDDSQALLQMRQKAFPEGAR